jgi:hypothetical protein
MNVINNVLDTINGKYFFTIHFTSNFSINVILSKNLEKGFYEYMIMTNKTNPPNYLEKTHNKCNFCENFRVYDNDRQNKSTK